MEANVELERTKDCKGKFEDVQSLSNRRILRRR